MLQYAPCATPIPTAQSLAWRSQGGAALPRVALLVEVRTSLLHFVSLNPEFYRVALMKQEEPKLKVRTRPTIRQEGRLIGTGAHINQPHPKNKQNRQPACGDCDGDTGAGVWADG